MSVAYLVIYEGEPEDRAAFLRYYTDHHLPLIWTWPKIRKAELELRAEAADAWANPSDIFMIARFTFDTLADLQAALDSDARQQAKSDRERFPVFNGTRTHQAVEIIDVPRPRD
jgi:uncharacterized protein (TIGR02118 family)